MEYRLLIDLDVVEILGSMRKRVRVRLLDQFHRIRGFPSNYSDYHAHDAIGRRVEICIFSGWAIHYWIDPADQHVRVLALKPADR